MKILALDIETAPNLAYVWGLFNQNIGINQIDTTGYVMCWAAKWVGEEEIMFESIFNVSPKRMLRKIHKLLSEADVVIHYNGRKFDIPTLNKEFVLNGLTPPAPYKQVDLFQTCRRVFRFVSNKLDFVAQQLGIGHKVRHEGHELWVKCMAKDPEAWGRMEEYNKQDVVLLEHLYNRLLPWIPNHPNRAVEAGKICCPACGSTNYNYRGYYPAKQHEYRRIRCMDCGKWYHENVRAWKTNPSQRVSQINS